MTKEYVLWGTPTPASKHYDKEDQATFGYQHEKIITKQTDKAIIEQARQWAEQNGFENLRVLVIDGSAPDFTKAVNV